MITEERFLDIDCPHPLENLVGRVLGGKEGDYVITAVLYGCRYSVQFSAFDDRNVTNLNVLEYVGAELHVIVYVN